MNFYEVKSKEKNSIFKPPNKIQFQVAADTPPCSTAEMRHGILAPAEIHTSPL